MAETYEWLYHRKFKNFVDTVSKVTVAVSPDIGF